MERPNGLRGVIAEGAFYWAGRKKEGNDRQRRTEKKIHSTFVSGTPALTNGLSHPLSIEEACRFCLVREKGRR